MKLDIFKDYVNEEAKWNIIHFFLNGNTNVIPMLLSKNVNKRQQSNKTISFLWSTLSRNVNKIITTKYLTSRRYQTFSFSLTVLEYWIFQFLLFIHFFKLSFETSE